MLAFLDLKAFGGDTGNLLMYGGAAVLGFLALRVFGKKPAPVSVDGTPIVPVADPVQAGLFGRLRERASNLIQHGTSLGLPLELMGVVQALASGNFLKAATAANGLFDALDAKPTRGFILDNIFDAQLQRQLSDPARREALIRKLDAAGFNVTPKSV